MFQIWVEKFPSLLEVKLKEGIFTESDIRRFLADQEFVNLMTDLQKQEWFSFKDVVELFFGKNKDNYKNAVRTKSFQVLSFLNSLKVHFLLNHQVYFSEILGALSEEEGERFHQDGKNNNGRLYFWMRQRAITDAIHKIYQEEPFQWRNNIFK